MLWLSHRWAYAHILNRYILKELGFKYPMTLSGLGLFASSVISFFLVNVLYHKLKHKDKIDRRFFATRIMPVGIFGALTLNFGNRVYLYLGVSLIQMLKAFTPVMTLLLMMLAGLSRPTPLLAASVFMLSVGTAVAAYGGGTSYSYIGLGCMFLAELFEAAKLVLVQILLASGGFKFSVIEGLY